MDSLHPAGTSGERPRSSSCSSLSDWVEISNADLGDELHGGDNRPRPKEKYPAKLHARSVRDQLGASDGLIYLPGRPSLTYDDSDQPVFFRQRRYFYYLSGINFPGCTVTYDISRDLLHAWIQLPRTGSSVIYNGPNPTRKEVMEKYDFDKVEYITGLYRYIDDFVNQSNSKVFLLRNLQFPKILSRPSQNSCIGSPTQAHYAINGVQIDNVQLQPAMDAARSLKSSYEIKMIRHASMITAKAHTNVLRSIKNLSNEAEIEAIFTATCIATQSRQQAYGIIAGSGTNASTLHYVANDEPLKGRQLVCLDAGCEWECYASDVTRTFPISGKFSKEAKEIYDIVAQMQEECIKMVKPGANYREIHLHAHKVAIKGLLKIGLLRGSFEELYAAGAAVAFFPHGLGHYLGLEVHDYGDGGYLLFGFKSKPESWASAYLQMVQEPFTIPASILKPTHVITVEPGIYFSRYALEEVYLKKPDFAKYINKDLLEKYYPVGGVRIEDDILVTEDGYENLTTAPKGDEALKIINAGGVEEVSCEDEVVLRGVCGREKKETKGKRRGWFS